MKRYFNYDVASHSVTEPTPKGGLTAFMSWASIVNVYPYVAPNEKITTLEITTLEITDQGVTFVIEEK